MKRSNLIFLMGFVMVIAAAFLWKNNFTIQQIIFMSAGYIVIAIGVKE